MWASGGGEELPEEVSPYAEDLARNGSWFFEAGVGNVWRPNVSIGWQPYVHGRWAWTAYGWTWVPNEPWGWAPYHYGRWDHSSAIGWYWIPGRTWGPAWVDWSVNGSHVGWRPLGYGGHHGGRHGNAVPRGSRRATAGPTCGERTWAHATSPRGRVAREAVGGTEMRIVEGTRGRLGRDLSVADGQQAVPRNIRTRPGPGDTVEELRSDPMTTIPFPVARRKYESAREREREREQQNNPSLAPRSRHGRQRRPSGGRTGDVDLGAPPRAAERRGGGAAAEGAAARGRVSDDGDREALRPWFRTLSRPRAEGESPGPTGARTRTRAASARRSRRARRNGGAPSACRLLRRPRRIPRRVPRRSGAARAASVPAASRAAAGATAAAAPCVATTDALTSIGGPER